MNLIIDIGNTRTKVALFRGAAPERTAVYPLLSLPALEAFLQDARPDRAFVAASGAWPLFLREWLDTHTRWSELSHSTPLPFESLYKTPTTLGRDRIAGLAGALALQVPVPFLVVDAGTCITMDLMGSDRIYRGGSISPGVAMRLRAMHDYTHRLPLVEPERGVAWPGEDTRTSLLAGSVWGAVLEIEGSIRRYEEVHGTINTVITGGDADLLAEKLKTMIFARRDLVLTGLNYLLNHTLHAR